MSSKLIRLSKLPLFRQLYASRDRGAASGVKLIVMHWQRPGMLPVWQVECAAEVHQGRSSVFGDHN
jgi:hypothetical protein